MARDRKDKLLTTVPPRFDPDFVRKLDRRFALSRVVADRLAALEAHRGGAEALSYVERSLVRRTVWLELICETYEQRFAQGRETDVGAITQLVNALKGLYKDLGLKPAVRRGSDLQTYLRRSGAGAEAGCA